MSRSTRQRKPPARYRTEDPPPDDEKKITSGRTRTQQGNGIIEKDVLVELRSPVLRDRTNLTVESSKNIISKKGVGGDKELDKVDKSSKMKKSNRTMRTRQKTEDPANDDKKVENVKRSTRTLKMDKKVQSPVLLSKANKKPGTQVTEKEPQVTPDVEKPTKIPRSTRTTRKILKRTDLSPQTSESVPKTRAKRSDNLKNSVQAPRITRSKILSNTSDKSSSTVTKSSNSHEKLNIVERKSKRLTVKVSDKSSQESENKFFKNKRHIILTHSKVSPMKRGIRKPRRPLIRKNNISPLKLHQPTLSESFAKVKKTLRPRRTEKNYNEESIIEKKKLPNNDNEHHLKAPVYKVVNIEEENPKDKDEVYEFSFDSNDSNERLPKKRKKRIIRKVPAKRAKKTVVPPTTSGPENANKISEKIKEKIPQAKSDIKTVKDNIKVGLKNRKLTGEKERFEPTPSTSGTQNSNKMFKKTEKKIPEAMTSIIKTVQEDNMETVLKFKKSEKKTPSLTPSSSQPNSPIEEIPEPFQVVVDVHVPSNYPPSPPSPMHDNSDSEDTAITASEIEPPLQKPKIISSERLEGSRRISLTSTPLHRKPTNDSRCGSTSIFQNRPSMQHKTMLNHSLIRRSFSPIVKQINEDFDSSSPWRPITTNTFSRVKNIFQSTPHGKKTLTPHGIHSLTTENKGVSTEINKINVIVEQNDENDNSSIINNNSSKKSPRKFGTVLSNVGSSPETSSSPKMPSLESNISVDNKENEIKSPKKSTQKQIRTPLASPTHSIEPQPGPSGLQKTRDKSRILKQSNLHGYLNIPDMPTSTSINTAHGIFDDESSTPIPGKTSNKIIAQHFDVDNAFGFEEDNSSGDFTDCSPIIENRMDPTRLKKNIIKNVKPTKIMEKNEKKPVRMPTRAVSKPSIETDVDKIQRVEVVKNVEKIKQVEKETSSGDVSEDDEVGVGEMISTKKTPEATKEDVVEAVHFLDTFDAEEKETSPVNVPLFVDPEPVHFKQPPRYSYGKRKRGVHYNTSDETEDDFHSEEDDDDDDNPKRKKKKRKMTKAEKEQRKKLDEWAKSINETFEEIDEFSLVVE